MPFRSLKTQYKQNYSNFWQYYKTEYFTCIKLHVVVKNILLLCNCELFIKQIKEFKQNLLEEIMLPHQK